MYEKFVVTGTIIGETKTHYITSVPYGVQHWNKQWYRLMPECSQEKHML